MIEAALMQVAGTRYLTGAVLALIAAVFYVSHANLTKTQSAEPSNAGPDVAPSVTIE